MFRQKNFFSQCAQDKTGLGATMFWVGFWIKDCSSGSFSGHLRNILVPDLVMKAGRVHFRWSEMHINHCETNSNNKHVEHSHCCLKLCGSYWFAASGISFKIKLTIYLRIHYCFDLVSSFFFLKKKKTVWNPVSWSVTVFKSSERI